MPAARPDQRPLYNVIAARNLFNPSRTETAAAPATAAAAAPKLFLHGVVLDDTRSRAFIEDPTSKKVFAYTVGDSGAGGKLETIKSDRVVIARPEGPVELLLRDPSRPQPTPPAAAPAAAPGRPGPAGTRPPATPLSPFLGATPMPPPATAAPAPDTPARAPGPRLLRPDLLQAPAAAPPSPEPNPRRGK